jgi:hypothetical protein
MTLRRFPRFCSAAWTTFALMFSVIATTVCAFEFSYAILEVTMPLGGWTLNSNNFSDPNVGHAQLKRPQPSRYFDDRQWATSLRTAAVAYSERVYGTSEPMLRQAFVDAAPTARLSGHFEWQCRCKKRQILRSP